MLSNDDYYQLEGGLNAAIRYCRGGVCAYHIDTSQAMQGFIIIKRLKHELAKAMSYKPFDRSWLLNKLNNDNKGGLKILTHLNCFCNFAITTGQTTN